jgi:hypothetical protein
MSSFNCLYLLESPLLQILEISRTDLLDTAALNERFRWLKIERESGRINKLSFRSMDSAGEVEERYFEEGFLKFNSTIGTFIEKFNSAQHHLERRKNMEISSSLRQAVSEHLKVAADL